MGRPSCVVVFFLNYYLLNHLFFIFTLYVLVWVKCVEIGEMWVMGKGVQ